MTSIVVAVVGVAADVAFTVVVAPAVIVIAVVSNFAAVDAVPSSSVLVVSFAVLSAAFDVTFAFCSCMRF